jgi:ectoine hydroxylase-related dioxygenase (phytanoyl-CoA dioxygenase family)
MNLQQAFRELGIPKQLVTDQERQQLDQQGFLFLYNVLNAEQVERIRARLDELLLQEGDAAGHETHTEAGTDRLSDLVNKDPLFDLCYTHPRVLSAVAHVLEDDVQLSSLNSRAALPGQGQQQLHSDGGYDAATGRFDSCQTTWVIDAFTAENGPTRVVPGSHRNPATPQEALNDPHAPHPDEIALIAPAGTVIVSAAHLWHSGTQNNTSHARRVLHCYFCRRDQPQQTNQREYLRPETAARLSLAARYLLNV